jgi:hypothetical protein
MMVVFTVHYCCFSAHMSICRTWRCACVYINVFFFSFREAVREMPESLTMKRVIKRNLVHSVSRKSRHTPLSTWKMLKYRLSRYFQKVSCLPHPSSITLWVIYTLADRLHRIVLLSKIFRCVYFCKIFFTSCRRLLVCGWTILFRMCI